MNADDAEAVAMLVVRCDATVADWSPSGLALPPRHAERERQATLNVLAGPRG